MSLSLGDPGTRAVLADLHVHVARAGGRPVKIAASARLTVAGIVEESVDRKGLDVVGIVDAHSPPVQAELQALLDSGQARPLASGGLGFESAGRRLALILAAEVEAAEPGLGPVHYLCYLPDLEAARDFTGFLAPLVTNVTLSSQRAQVTGEALARRVGAAGGFLVPAHVFTPYKGFFGQGGVDLGQAFSDRALDHVPAVELGLSADTALADLVPSLAPFTYVTNSDAHSPETIGREHNAFPGPGPGEGEEGRPAVDETGAAAGAERGAGLFSFDDLAGCLRRGAVVANYGLDPRLGKYHRAFCPKCGYVSAGDIAAGKICPACGRTGLVKGVLDRILTIAASAARPARPRPPYVHIVPLRYMPAVGPATRRKLHEAFGTEMNVLHRVPEEDLAEVAGTESARRIAAARAGTGGLDISPGAGGRYGRLRPGAQNPRPGGREYG